VDDGNIDNDYYETLKATRVEDACFDRASEVAEIRGMEQ